MSDSRASANPAFTLVELLVAMAIVSLLVVMLVSMTSSVGRIWSQSIARVEEFRDAREAFDSIVRKLGQATLNPYLDYVDASGNFRVATSASSFVPASYKRRSEMRLICGNAATLTGESNAPTHAIFFQAPLGYVTNTASYADLENVVNTVGYFIEYGDDSQLRPGFLGASTNIPLHNRFRLMEMVEPSDTLTLYKYTSGPPPTGQKFYTGHDWFTTPFNETVTSTPPRPVTVLADNIVALVILPQLSPADQKAGGYDAGSLAPNYFYDSTGTNMSTVNDPNLDPINQLPPVVQVTLVAVDETSFNRLNPGTAMPSFTSNLFTSTNYQSNPTQYQADLNQLQANLLGKSYAGGGTAYTSQRSGQTPLNYRIFTTNVSLKAAKWSRSQTQ